VKPPKPPKAVALKKRPRPSEKKSTAAPPAQATPSAQATPPAGAPEQPAAKTAAGGGPGAPEALKQ
jgi:hypothetical protein